ncbi:MAG: PTS sugar transporter subunit IIA [Myxococcota bacterium]
MVDDLMLTREAIRLDAPVESVRDVAGVAAAAITSIAGMSPVEDVKQALLDCFEEGGVCIGRGVAIPHAVVPSVREPVVGLVRAATPLELADAPDGHPVDLFFFVLAVAGKEREHLQVVAHLARIARSRSLLEALRRARRPAEVLATLDEPTRAAPAETLPDFSQGATELVLVELEGEVVSDRVLLELAEQGYDDSLVVEGQSLRRSLSRQLPLFASFRDLFGDPGSRRLVFLVTRAEEVEILVRLVRRACRDSDAEAARVLSFPLARSWTWSPAAAPESTGHG